MSEVSPKTVLTIAGFDPSSGAGATADLKTIAAHGLYGTACITSLTVQSTQGVKRFEAVSPRLVQETLETLLDDISPDAVKIGMLGTGRIAEVVAEFLRKNQLPNIVLDPVLRSSSGAPLLDEPGVQVLREQLLSLADVITPNLDEAAVLTGLAVASESEMEDACQRFRRLGAKNTVITGGHLPLPVDVLLAAGRETPQRYRQQKVATKSTHGTGCAYSTAIACNLAKGISLAGEEPNAVSLAGGYIQIALQAAHRLGQGRGPINHFHNCR